MAVILDSRRDLTLAACHRVAWEGEAVSFGPRARAAMAEARARFLTLIDAPDAVIYGVTSGYGQNAMKRLSPEERKVHAKSPPVSAAASWGDPLPERAARAIVFARLANFVEGHAAVSPPVAEAVAAMLDGGAMPQVPARGQGGAGEILSLSHLFLGLARSLDLKEKDALSLINGSPAAAGLVADGALAAARRLDLATEVLALAAEAFNAPLEHFAVELEDYWNNPHDAWALRRLRELIGGGHGGPRRPYQAPVSFRILPRILGQMRRAAAQAEDVAAQSLGAVSDNPVILPPSAGHPHGQAISTGGFHNAQAPMALDALTSALANLCLIVERLAAKLLDGSLSLLPPQLGSDEGRSYLGCLPMALTGYEEEARLLAQPTLLPGSESGGFGQNDVASPVFLAWSKHEKAGELLESALAGLGPIAMRAFAVTGRPVPAGLEDLAATLAQAVPDVDPARPMGPQCGLLAAQFRSRIYGALGGGRAGLG